jgi:triacylglycerol lipase
MKFARSKFAALAIVAAVLALLLSGPGTPANAASSPTHPVSPYGSNIWTCKPTAAHPYPVILLHGTYGDQESVFDYLSWYVSASGYCVFSMDYGFYGTDPIEKSAGELSTFVNEILAVTGATKVSIIGHSQGGTMPRYYIKYLGGADKVDDLIGFVPANHGTTWTGLLTLVPGFFCQACVELMAGSSFLANLNAGGESPGPVSYTNIVTRDECCRTTRATCPGRTSPTSRSRTTVLRTRSSTSTHPRTRRSSGLPSMHCPTPVRPTRPSGRSAPGNGSAAGVVKLEAEHCRQRRSSDVADRDLASKHAETSLGEDIGQGGKQ